MTQEQDNRRSVDLLSPKNGVNRPPLVRSGPATSQTHT